MCWNLKCIFISSTTIIFTNLSTSWDTNIKTAQMLRTSTFSMILYRGRNPQEYWTRTQVHARIRLVADKTFPPLRSFLSPPARRSPLSSVCAMLSYSRSQLSCINWPPLPQTLLFSTSPAQNTAKQQDLQKETIAAAREVGAQACHF